jgi:acyl-CoA thioester hydrolase
MNKQKYTIEHAVTLTIPLHDTDAMQVVWHGHYLKYFEIARDSLFYQVGIDLYEFYTKSWYLFPIIRSSVKYISPLRIRNDIVCLAQVKDARRKIVIDFSIRRLSDNLLCAVGSTEQVAVSCADMSMEMEIPIEIRRALGF